MKNFVDTNSVVRKIWGRSDVMLFIFAGAAAEFALNKAVDWLYFTGKLPADPLARMFSTVSYARRIVFASEHEANKAIDSMRQIHIGVEQNRGTSIPDWAYRDVLFMLIHYSIASFECLERKLSEAEKEEVFDVFNRVGIRMGLINLPSGYRDWIVQRELHLQSDLRKSHYTNDLFLQYRKHLGKMRYFLLIEGQKLTVPPAVKKLLDFSDHSILLPVIPLYKFCRIIKMDRILRDALLPSGYKTQIRELDINPV